MITSYNTYRLFIDGFNTFCQFPVNKDVYNFLYIFKDLKKEFITYYLYAIHYYYY